MLIHEVCETGRKDGEHDGRYRQWSLRLLRERVERGESGLVAGDVADVRRGVDESAEADADCGADW